MKRTFSEESQASTKSVRMHKNDMEKLDNKFKNSNMERKLWDFVDQYEKSQVIPDIESLHSMLIAHLQLRQFTKILDLIGKNVDSLSQDNSENNNKATKAKILAIKGSALQQIMKYNDSIIAYTSSLQLQFNKIVHSALLSVVQKKGQISKENQQVEITPIEEEKQLGDMGMIENLLQYSSYHEKPRSFRKSWRSLAVQRFSIPIKSRSENIEQENQNNIDDDNQMSEENIKSQSENSLIFYHEESSEEHPPVRIIIPNEDNFQQFQSFSSGSQREAKISEKQRTLRVHMSEILQRSNNQISFCTICSTRDPGTAVILPCLHQYHEFCFIKSLDYKEFNRCSLCKVEVFTHNLFSSKKKQTDITLQSNCKMAQIQKPFNLQKFSIAIINSTVINKKITVRLKINKLKACIGIGLLSNEFCDLISTMNYSFPVKQIDRVGCYLITYNGWLISDCKPISQNFIFSENDVISMVCDFTNLYITKEQKQKHEDQKISISIKLDKVLPFHANFCVYLHSSGDSVLIL